MTALNDPVECDEMKLRTRIAAGDAAGSDGEGSTVRISTEEDPHEIKIRDMIDAYTAVLMIVSIPFALFIKCS
jgi:hypothetical protein